MVTKMSKMSKNKEIIHLENVWKIYSMGEVEVSALKGISLTVNQGDFLAITGSSGSGKSTMMNLVGCLDLPTRGLIYLDGRDISMLSESELARIRGKKIGFIFQQFNLIPNMTALENVMLPMDFQDFSGESAVKRATGLLNLVGLGDRMNHRPSQLSGGQQQRVAIARSLSNDPEVILADEPTGNLDTETGNVILDLFQQLNEQQKVTIIMVTHEPDVAARAKRIIELRDGKIIKDTLLS